MNLRVYAQYLSERAQHQERIQCSQHARTISVVAPQLIRQRAAYVAHMALESTVAAFEARRTLDEAYRRLDEAKRLLP